MNYYATQGHRDEIKKRDFITLQRVVHERIAKLYPVIYKKGAEISFDIERELIEPIQPRQALTDEKKARAFIDEYLADPTRSRIDRNQQTMGDIEKLLVVEEYYPELYEKFLARGGEKLR
jgi:hypothetical protein